MSRVSFTHWFHWLSLIRLAFDTVACWTLLEGGFWQWLPALRISGKGPVARAVIVMVIWTLSLVNGLFLLFIDFMRTNTHWGCFLAQQVISGLILVLMAVWMIIYRSDPNPWPVAWGLSSASLGLTLIISLALWYRFIAAGKLAQWRVNAGELAANITPLTKDAITNSHLGVLRKEEQTEACVLRMFYYSLFRTVSPVESIPYALSHNIFALAAVILIIMRLVCSIFDIGSGDFLTRIIVEPRADWATVPPGQADKWGLSLVVGHPEDRGVDVSWTPNPSGYSSHVQVAIGSISGSLGYDNATDDMCSDELVCSTPNATNKVDWFRRYTCNMTLSRSVKISDLGFKYIISPTNASEPTDVYNLPRLWFQNFAFIDPFGPVNDSQIPYMVPPLEPVPGMYTMTNLNFAQRRFIITSWIEDAISAAEPMYDKVPIYPWVHFSSRPVLGLNNAPADQNSGTTAYGFVRWPTPLVSSLSTTRKYLQKGKGVDLCEVVEEYRGSSLFYSFGSLGGLLALLQGLHVFLFGRPLFWGLFGAKLITPFGLVGKFLPSKQFKDRLQNHYYPTQKTAEEQAREEQETVLMTRFLLDYVIDMGPVPEAPKGTPTPSYSTPPEDGSRPGYQRLPSSNSDQNGQDTGP